MFIFDIRKIMLIIITSIIFLNLSVYLPVVGLYPLPGYTIDIMIFSFLFFFYLKKGLTFPINNMILLWLLYYTVLNIIYFLASSIGMEEYTIFKLIIFFIFFIFSMLMYFNLDDSELTFIRKTLIPLAIIAMITLGIDFFDPGFFLRDFTSAIYYEAGRAASLYLNANIAGGAMVVFLIFTIDLIPKKLRILYIMIIFLGVFFTMSRSNLMIFFLTIGLMTYQKKLYTRHLFISFAGIVTFFIILATGGLEMLADKYDFEVTDNMMSRINFFADSSKSNTGDMNERKRVLMAALEMFADEPIFGNGFASTRLWQYKVSPHNTFALNWADFGFFGVLIIPLLLYFATYNIFKFGSNNQKNIALLTIIYFIGSSFFSHNMLEQPLSVGIMVALAVMGHKSKNNFKKRKNI